MRNGYDELISKVRPPVEDYYETRTRETATHDGELWFEHRALSEQADVLAGWFDTIAGIFRKEAERFRTGHL
ncbi:hypothetical protein AB0878_48955 [Amycolatopsis sp. NPDC047767]|uniref:hypothetical protein n=1 Tax=Amycolatopsis sp. NPDC047767 TaxID=3156765 RepID=UPI003456F3AC